MTEGCSKGHSNGTLYVVATPIGNLGDVTLRAVEILKRVRIVAAEDTRRSRVLLEHIDAYPARLVSLHDFNEADRIGELVDELQRGNDVAIVSDAGTPLVSDPGYLLVRECWQRGIPVSPVPGPSALTAALSVSPLPVDRFQFLGFLPAKDKPRRECLESALAGVGTIVFFEAPHRLRDTLETIAALVGDERRVVVAKELTKVHERIEFGAVSEVMARLAASDALERGEFVCMIEAISRAPLASHAHRVMDVLLAELPPAQAARLGAKLTEAARSELYEYAVSVSDRSPGRSGERQK